MTWNSLAALLAITSVVTTAVSVGLSCYLLRGSPQNINTQTVTIEQQSSEVHAELASKAYEEIMHGMRRGSPNGRELGGELGDSGVRGVGTQRLCDLLDRLEAIIQRGERSLWLVDVMVVALSVTCILFVLMGFLAPLFFVIRALPGG